MRSYNSINSCCTLILMLIKYFVASYARDNNNTLALQLERKEHSQDQQIFLLNEGWFNKNTSTCLLSFSLHFEYFLRDDIEHVTLNIPVQESYTLKNTYLINHKGHYKYFRKMKLHWKDGDEETIQASITKPLVKRVRQLHRNNKRYPNLRFEFGCEESHSTFFLQESFLEIKTLSRRISGRNHKKRSSLPLNMFSLKVEPEKDPEKCQKRFVLVNFRKHISKRTVPADLALKLSYCSGECNKRKENSIEDVTKKGFLSKCCVPKGYESLYYLALTIKGRLRRMTLHKAYVTGCHCV